MTNHLGQLVKNYEKNARLGLFVIFVVPDEEVEDKVKAIFDKVGKEEYSIYKIHCL